MYFTNNKNLNKLFTNMWCAMQGFEKYHFTFLNCKLYNKSSFLFAKIITFTVFYSKNT